MTGSKVWKLKVQSMPNLTVGMILCKSLEGI